MSTASNAEERRYKTELHPAFIVNSVKADEIERLAKAGAEGVEVTGTKTLPIAEARKARKIVEDAGLRVHSVMCGGANFNRPESAEADVEEIKRSLRVAAELGASAALLVPGRIDAAYPPPGELAIEFDPQTLHITKLSQGDDSAFAEYIRLQNEATDATRRYLERVLPTAAYEGVTLGIENVWNNLWVDPRLYAALIRSFGNVWLKSYFDLGNHVKYSKTEDWLAALGPGAIVKLHIKDFLIDETKPSRGGFEGFVPIGKGSIDWISVRDAIEKVGYSGFVTIESGGYSPEAHVQVLRDIFAGRPISVEPDV